MQEYLDIYSISICIEASEIESQSSAQNAPLFRSLLQNKNGERKKNIKLVASTRQMDGPGRASPFCTVQYALLEQSI